MVGTVKTLFIAHWFGARVLNKSAVVEKGIMLENREKNLMRF